MTGELLKQRINEHLGPEVLDLLLRIGTVAQEQNSQAYLIGGVVRDLLLGIGSVDLDIMLEDDSGPFVKCLFSVWPDRFRDFPPVTKPILYKKYKTAKLAFARPIAGGIERLDFSTARAERYPVPGSIPEILPGTLATDLERRDFSVNALAVALSGPAAGELIDRSTGMADLQAGLLRVLHPNSFADDPARLIRAVRFSVRFSFALEPHTAELFSGAVAAKRLLTLPPARLFDEFRKSLDENNPRVLGELDRSGMLAQIDPALSGFDSVRLTAMHRAVSGKPPAGAAAWQLMLGLLAAVIGEAKLEAFLTRFGRPAADSAAVMECLRLTQAATAG